MNLNRKIIYTLLYMEELEAQDNGRLRLDFQAFATLPKTNIKQMTPLGLMSSCYKFGH